MLLSYSGEKKTDFSIMDMAAVYKNMCVALTKYRYCRYSYSSFILGEFYVYQNYLYLEADNAYLLQAKFRSGM